MCLCVYGTGYQQANVIMLPKNLADDFEEFCCKNPAPLPLLYRSQSGEASCPPLAKHADIRTDIPQYCAYEDGHLVKTVSSLQSYRTHLWSDMVCFYQGCSFGFEGRLKNAGVPVRNVEQGVNVSMYRTTVPCVPAGVFRCLLVVTMRPIPAGMLNAAVKITHLNPLAHGAPIHIGDPAFLGIRDLSRPDYGDIVKLQPGDIPVFWACGVTAIEAILSSKPSLAFSHSPGCMFLTDIPVPPFSESVDPPTSNPNLQMIPLCFRVSNNPLLYSLASQGVVEKIRQLEKIIQEDPGERGIRALFVQDELLLSVPLDNGSISVHCCLCFPFSPPEETDGPPGAFAMATILLSLGKQVTMVMDKRALGMNKDIIAEAVQKGVLKTEIQLVTFESSDPNSALRFLCHDGDPNKPRYDHLVAIERSGRAEDGNHYNMKGVNIKHLVDPIDDLFIAAKNIPGISTTGIGDGGNELGMGKVKEKVKFATLWFICLYPLFCSAPSPAGVSNWGGYAVACGLYLLHTCPSHQRYLKKGLGIEPTTTQEQLQDWTENLPSVTKEESILSTLVRFEIRSGKTGHLAMEVDGLTFYPTHSDIITRLREVTLGCTTPNP
uniref:D-glutamate cyclase-like C-terminal domain-containing protein n=1 Tax=Mola mola TaxID=94237 RepID=A0A3Q4BRV4_MOLML